MEDTFFKVIIRDALWDVRSEAKRFGTLFQLFIDQRKPTEVFIKYKNAKDAVRARASLAVNENVERVESLKKWDIRPKRPTENKKSDDNASVCSSASAGNVQHRGPVVNGPLTSEPMPLMMGMFNMCTVCRKGGASFQCFVCGTYYCGEICQRNDWPSHIMQCLPRLVRVQSGFVPIEPQFMGFPNVMQSFGSNNFNNNINNGPVQAARNLNVPNQPAGNKENGPNHKQSNNQRPAGTKPSDQLSKKPVEQSKPVSPTKLTPSCSVPTNVLKNLALQRHQEQEPAVLAKVPVAQVTKTEGTISKETSKLAKRVQQKMAVTKQEIRYGAFPREGECVKISYLTGNMLYVYRAGQEANGQPNRYLDFVKRSVLCARDVKEVLQTAPNVNDVVFAPFDGDFYRAIVKSIEGTKVVVFFPDFGNTQTVEWMEMKEIPDKAIQYGMCYTHGVMIDGVPTFSRLVQAFLSELLEMDEFTLVKVRDEKPVKVVDLRHVQELYQLSAKLLEIAKKEQEMEKPAVEKPAVEKPAAEKPAVKETAATVPDPASYVPVTAEDFTEHDLPMGEELHLMIVEASELTISNQISVILNSDNAAFAKVISECERYGNADPNPYHPESDHEAFLLHFDSIWCRAMLAANNDEMQYYLLDLGLIRTLNEKPNCRRYPAGMTRKIFVCECFVENTDALGKIAPTGGNEQLLGRTLKATMSLQEDGGDEAMRLKIHSMD
uniref:MYND-type domain-containing protein n=1 Tax=Anopheles funestus TaxID=62324 RepID=A0A182RHY5_ANOFN